MSKPAATLSERAGDLGSIWLKISAFAGLAVGLITIALVCLSPAIAIAWALVESVRAFGWAATIYLVVCAVTLGWFLCASGR